MVLHEFVYVDSFDLCLLTFATLGLAVAPTKKVSGDVDVEVCVTCIVQKPISCRIQTVYC